MNKLSSNSKKSVTNLNTESDCRAALLEPFKTGVYNLGSASYTWNEVYANKFPQPVDNVYKVVLATAWGDSPAAPATKALNQGLDYYLKFNSSTTTELYSYKNPNLTPVLVTPVEGMIFFVGPPLSASGVSANFYNSIFYYGNGKWLRKHLTSIPT